ncbi:MAG: cobalt-precorrin-5B (C(1))-methyltransferase [Prevotella sp.]|nr:cobalt-precorrin-5B (C(1))-methyltransferase [Prevotella sp.]
MILVFGGTTEGRRVVEVLEEAGTRYYYSTKGGEKGQQVGVVNGIHITGGMDVAQMTAFCRDHGIRLVVDAAHPFAEALHRNLLLAAQQTGTPVIRYDRIYPKHDSNLTWCKDFNDAARQLAAQGVDRLLALTGVNSIGRLKPFWEKHPECWFRILNRQTSLRVAQANGFPEEQLVYYETDDTAQLIGQLRPDAVITKESGLSGGFTEKVETARQAGVKVFVVERPPYPTGESVETVFVNGPYGLRRAVERLLPQFYPLHSGLTTGTCATAAAVAACQLLRPEAAAPAEVPVVLPNGETIHVPVVYGDGYASCFKEAGDDPDITDGIEVRASVRQSDQFEIAGGEGVGTITLPGFDYPPGSPAINKGPREMIRRNLGSRPLKVTIFIPNGAEIAKKTFNPRLGIEGGLSVIGVSGIVKPFSEAAFIDSIRKCMTIAKASGTERVVINSGGKSERFVKALYPDLPQQAFVEYGNYVGETLKMASELHIGRVTLGVMLGKAVKLAAGHLDTHSRKTTMDLDFIRQMLAEAGIAIDIGDITLARELWERIPAGQLQTFCNVVIGHCRNHCVPLLPEGELTILLIGDDGTIYSLSQEHPQGQ